MENPFETIETRLANLESKIEKLITKLDNPDLDTPIWMTSKQLAQHLSISVTAVSNLRINKIPYYKLGGRIYYKKQEIDEWLEKSRHKAGSEYLNEYLGSRR